MADRYTAKANLLASRMHLETSFTWDQSQRLARAWVVLAAEQGWPDLATTNLAMDCLMVGITADMVRAALSDPGVRPPGRDVPAQHGEETPG